MQTASGTVEVIREAEVYVQELDTCVNFVGGGFARGVFIRKVMHRNGLLL